MAGRDDDVLGPGVVIVAVAICVGSFTEVTGMDLEVQSGVGLTASGCGALRLSPLGARRTGSTSQEFRYTTFDLLRLVGCYLGISIGALNRGRFTSEGCSLAIRIRGRSNSAVPSMLRTWNTNEGYKPLLSFE